MMFERPEKHSLTLKGHRTSVSLEPVFWRAFISIAQKKSKSINALAADIDTDRGANCGLASAIRLFVLEELSQSSQGMETPLTTKS